ncbi:MAG TPA: alpha/beta hydrolase fold domain-containing protein [Steroidobacteraceae bacterium]|nr:alpha/beta hydrolase fold domain-containing protein [Steroidobacteraceae bacterium]
MTSHRDIQFIRAFGQKVAACGLPQDVADYRHFIAHIIDPNKHMGGDDRPVEYLESVHISPGLTADIAAPTGPGLFPVMMNCHGNGLITGSARSYRRFTTDLARGGYVAVTPDYRLAPEHLFPAAHEDMKAAVHWARDHIDKFKGDGTRLAICGDSMAASLALGVVLALAGEANAPRIAAFVGIEGVYDRREDSYFGGPDSYMSKAYLGPNVDASMLADPRVSPQVAISAGVKMPATLLITGSADIAAIPTLKFSLALQEAQIPHELHLLENMPHDFMKFSDLDGMRVGHELMFRFLARHV